MANSTMSSPQTGSVNLGAEIFMPRVPINGLQKWLLNITAHHWVTYNMPCYHSATPSAPQLPWKQSSKSSYYNEVII